ncbi:ascorbate-specific PTS system enzyme IIC [Enterococcus faecium 1,231,501]|nr:ascorbate-specific PTS system enzyme IIC [Enterococcus faecium 1,231,501]MBL4993121.1 PTS beta-glucoside transporter subunit IIBC [Enterococcus lactis]
MFQTGFHIKGVVASPEAATALAQTEFAFVTSSTLILGFIMNLVIARITPFKNIFFTTGHSLFFACVLSLILKAHNFSDVAAIIVGGLLLGFFSAALPQLCQPFMRKIT